jgi:hypothetical protein
VLARRSLLLGGLALAAMPRAVRPAHAVVNVAFHDLYERESVLTEKVKALAGAPVEMIGYMAPPLKAEAKFFVLTSMPMSFCPFCETEAQWPSDIVLVLLDHTLSAVPFNVRIRVSGTLELGFDKDPETGFVSLIRLRSAHFGRA